MRKLEDLLHLRWRRDVRILFKMRIEPADKIKAGPVPRLEGISIPTSPLQAQSSGGLIPIPRLLPEKAQQYAALFDQSGAHGGALDGMLLKQLKVKTDRL